MPRKPNRDRWTKIRNRKKTDLDDIVAMIAMSFSLRDIALIHGLSYGYLRDEVVPYIRFVTHCDCAAHLTLFAVQHKLIRQAPKTELGWEFCPPHNPKVVGSGAVLVYPFDT